MFCIDIIALVHQLVYTLIHDVPSILIKSIGFDINDAYIIITRFPRSNIMTHHNLITSEIQPMGVYNKLIL